MLEFEWDQHKELINFSKHGISFHSAMHVFSDPYRCLIEDIQHGESEQRYYCIGKMEGKIRIFGAGCWRKGRLIYEEKKKST